MDLLTYLKPKKGRLPTFYMVRRVVQNLDFDQLSRSFCKWAQQHTGITENKWLEYMKGRTERRDVSAQVCCRGIRSHWSIENGLHWVKDVTFKELYSEE